MEHNLLEEWYDYNCQLFIDGEISHKKFKKIEKQYKKRYYFYIINLN